MEPVVEKLLSDRSSAQRILSGCSALAVMLVIYGSWLPFEFDTSSLMRLGFAVVDRIAWVPSNTEDVVANIAVFIIIGLLVTMRLLVGGWNRATRAVFVMIVAALASMICEGGQTIIAQRCASYTDMLLHGLGTMIGILLAEPTLLLTQRFIRQLSVGLVLSPHRALFGIVALMVVLAKLAPFDFAISPASLAHSVSTARWSPFDPASAALQQSGLGDLTETAGSFFAFALLGILGVGSLRERGESRIVSLVDTVGKLIVLATGIELAQIVIVSHTCDALDLMLYVYGGCIGAGICVAVRGSAADAPHLAVRRVAARVLLTAALLVQAVVVVGCIFPAGVQSANPSTSSIQWIPFYAHLNEPLAKSIGQVVSSAMWYSTLAVVFASASVGRIRRYRFLLALLATVCLVLLTEAAQVFDQARVADLTEPLLALGASAVAVFACRWIERQCRVEPHMPIVESA
jgi:glycopeptide antibiotics resistance protein